MRLIVFILTLLSFTAKGQDYFYILNQSQGGTPGCSYSATAPNTSGLIGWWKVDAGLTMSGSNVTAWADQSGNGHNFTAQSGKEPALTGCSIVFDGTSDAIRVPSFAVSSQNVTVFIVAAKNNASTLAIPFEFSPNYNQNNAFTWVWNDASATFDYAGIRQNTGTTGYNAHGTNNSTARSSMGSAMGVYTLSYNSADANPETSIEWKGTVYQQQFSTFNLNTSITFGTNELWLGARGGASFFAKMDIKEIRIFNRKLTTAERAAEQQYLNTKYGL